MCSAEGQFVLQQKVIFRKQLLQANSWVLVVMDNVARYNRDLYRQYCDHKIKQ